MIKAAQDIILKPVITERSMDDLQVGKYTFKVAKDANKTEIKKATLTLKRVSIAFLISVLLASLATLKVYLPT